MMKRIYIFSISVLLLALGVLSCSSENWSVSSPDGKIGVGLIRNEAGELAYRVWMRDSSNQQIELVKPSPLGIVREDQVFDTLVFIAMDQPKTVEESYVLATGKRLKNRNHYNELTYHFKNTKGALLDLVFRAYDDGVAFKYVFPGEDQNKTYKVLSELTGFNLPAGLAWMQPYDKPSAYSPAYEQNYRGEIEIGASSPNTEGWCFPALFGVKHHWLMISEANLRDNFYGSHLGNPKGGLYRVMPPLAEEAFGYGNAFAESTLPWDMPWRMIVVGDELGDIVESNLVDHLSDASVIKDPSWVKAGRASWAWWSGYLDGTNDTPGKLKKYIDFAKEMSWEYSLIDAGWDYRKGFDLKELADYAQTKGVKLLLWYNSGGPTNRVNAGPRDLMYDREIRRKEMKRIADLGIKGIKIDFFGSDKQVLMKLYHGILEDAADYKLMVDFHGCTIPRGWSRTYPNLISMESVVGEEGYIYHQDYTEGAPMHCTILPFTRNVIGPMDYTPVAFSVQQYPHLTSYGFELALSVVFESGIQHFADKAEVYRAQPESIINFLKDVPAAWDNTKFLSGYPGKDVVIARQSGNNWYIGGINGEKTTKQIKVNFGFLNPGNTYHAVFITDGTSNTSFSAAEKTITSQSEETIDVLPVGGFVIQLKQD